jgi:hypothetical protein
MLKHFSRWYLLIVGQYARVRSAIGSIITSPRLLEQLGSETDSVERVIGGRDTLAETGDWILQELKAFQNRHRTELEAWRFGCGLGTVQRYTRFALICARHCILTCDRRL